MIFTDMNVRPARESDRTWIDASRQRYWDADLELPKGLRAPGVETAVLTQNHVPIASLTATQAVVLDPLIRNTDVDSDPRKLIAGIIAMERALAYSGQNAGVVDAYIAVPEQLTEYHDIVRKAGYVETIQRCKVFRRALNADTHPLLGDARDALQRAKMTQ